MNFLKLTLNVVVFLFSFSCSAYALDSYEAREFAADYEQEIKRKNGTRPSLDIKTDIKVGVANYKEEEQNIKSEYKAVYPEVLFSVTKPGESDVETSLELSFGQTLADVETWYISGEKYQTNDLDFSRVNIKGSVGKILYSDKYQNLQVIPFGGYGFRFIRFERTNFNILNVITSREVITEKYYLYHLNFGIKFDKKMNDKFAILGLADFAYVFSNQAENSALGRVVGGGGYLVDGDLNLQYSLNSSWKLSLGGFIELQNLKGGERGNVIWPDNKLNIYGGRIGIQYNF